MAQARACAVALVGWVPGESDTEARVARADDKDPFVRVLCSLALDRTTARVPEPVDPGAGSLPTAAPRLWSRSLRER